MTKKDMGGVLIRHQVTSLHFQHLPNFAALSAKITISITEKTYTFYKEKRDSASKQTVVLDLCLSIKLNYFESSTKT